MTVESASFISGLVPAYPPGSDSISEGDDHLRLLKNVLQGTFPNANAAINGIHTGTSAPTAKTAGTIWYDTTASNKVLKIYNGSGWTTLSTSPETDFKLLGATNVGWILPTADGSANQYLKTDASGNLDWVSPAGSDLPSQTGNSGKFLTTDGSAVSWAAAPGTILATTHARIAGNAVNRSATYIDSGLAFSHTKTVAASDLYIDINITQETYANFVSATHMYVYIQLTDSSGTIITDTNTNQQIMGIEDVGQGTGVTWDHLQGWSWIYKVTNANCPTPGAASQSFKIYTKLTNASDMGSDFLAGRSSVMVWEVAT